MKSGRFMDEPRKAGKQRGGMAGWKHTVWTARPNGKFVSLKERLSTVEGDVRGAFVIATIAKQAGATAARRAKANNLPRVMYKAGQLICVSDGVAKVLSRDDASTARATVNGAYFSKVKVGQVYARAK